MQAVSGYMSVMGEKDGPPVKSMIPVADLATAIHGYGAIVGALFRRERTANRQGQHIDMSMMDVMVSTLTVVAARYLITGEIPRRFGTENPQRVPSAAFECADGRFLQAVPNQRQWPAFSTALGHPDWAEDPRYATPVERTKNQDTLYPMVREAMLAQPLAAWRAIFEQIGVACGPINDLAEVFSDPQVLHREMLQSFDFPGVGTVPAVALPFRYSDASCEIRRRPPMLGEHTAEVLRELGRTDDQIRALADSGAVRLAQALGADVT
jgi:crotonobetainyl-CoA:carnitine CoA-transferase CaiB-like acyl-CoA transferase